MDMDDEIIKIVWHDAHNMHVVKCHSRENAWFLVLFYVFCIYSNVLMNKISDDKNEELFNNSIYVARHIHAI